MIIVTIGDVSRRLSSSEGIDENWVTLRMKMGRTRTGPPGVHVRVQAPRVELNLSAGEHARSVVFGRPLRPDEARVVELWRQRGLDRADFSSGQLTAFLHQVYDFLEPCAAPLGAGVKMVVGVSRFSETRP